MTECGKRANEAEKAERYDIAYHFYVLAIEIFMPLIKCKIKFCLINFR